MGGKPLDYILKSNEREKNLKDKNDPHSQYNKIDPKSILYVGYDGLNKSPSFSQADSFWHWMTGNTFTESLDNMIGTNKLIYSYQTFGGETGYFIMRGAPNEEHLQTFRLTNWVNMVNNGQATTEQKNKLNLPLGHSNRDTYGFDLEGDGRIPEGQFNNYIETLNILDNKGREKTKTFPGYGKDNPSYYEISTNELSDSKTEYQENYEEEGWDMVKNVVFDNQSKPPWQRYNVSEEDWYSGNVDKSLYDKEIKRYYKELARNSTVGDDYGSYSAETYDGLVIGRRENTSSPGYFNFNKIDPRLTEIDTGVNDVDGNRIFLEVPEEILTDNSFTIKGGGGDKYKEFDLEYNQNLSTLLHILDQQNSLNGYGDLQNPETSRTMSILNEMKNEYYYNYYIDADREHEQVMPAWDFAFNALNPFTSLSHTSKWTFGAKDKQELTGKDRAFNFIGSPRYKNMDIYPKENVPMLPKDLMEGYWNLDDYKIEEKGVNQ